MTKPELEAELHKSQETLAKVEKSNATLKEDLKAATAERDQAVKDLDDLKESSKDADQSADQSGVKLESVNESLSAFEKVLFNKSLSSVIMKRYKTLKESIAELK